jgi:hypothetical protein
MVKALLTFGWLRDFAIILLLVAGNHVRANARAVGIMIMVCAAVMFTERFLWSWYADEQKELRENEAKRAKWDATSPDLS